MKVKEFVEFMNNDKNKMMKSAQLADVVAKALETKKYIGIKEKKALVASIIGDSLVYEDGVVKFDEISKYVCCTMKTIEKYTNLELSEDIEDDYDMLCEAGLLNIVIKTFDGEYDNVRLLLQMQSDYVLSDNNVESMLGKFLDKTSNKISDFSDKIVKKLEGFDVNKIMPNLEGLSNLGDLSKLTNFLNFQMKK